MLGALNALNPVYQILRGGVDTFLAIDRGDYRAAGAGGTKTMILAAATVFGAGKGLGAIAEESLIATRAARVGLKANAEQVAHILNGHGPGTTVSGKGAFPKAWTNEQAISAIERVANSPKSTWVQSGGTPGATHYKNGAPMKYVVSGRDHGLDLEVIVEPDGRGIVTGYPTNVPRNP